MAIKYKHLATYTPTSGASGPFSVLGWKSTAWGGGVKGKLHNNVISDLGLDENATALDAQNFLKSKGYNIATDNYWGKQSQAAYDDYMSRIGTGASNSVAPNTSINTLPTQLPTKIQTYTPSIQVDPVTGMYNYSPDYNIVTSQDLKDAGITNWKRYNKFMNDPNNKNSNIYNMFKTYQDQTGNIINNRNDFNRYFGTTGRYGNKDRNSILNTIEDAQLNYDNQMLGKKYMYGGTINKYQQGGQVDQQQQMQEAFLQYLAQKTGAQSQEELEKIIQQMGKEGLQQAYQQFMQEMQQQQVQAARFGAKLNYIQKLGGKCPAGTELVYYKSGGKLCKKCLRKQMEEGKEDGDVIQQFKKSRKKK